jgi:hypothetical protein
MLLPKGVELDRVAVKDIMSRAGQPDHRVRLWHYESHRLERHLGTDQVSGVSGHSK